MITIRIVVCARQDDSHRTFLPIQISTHDELPQKICSTCHRKCSEWQLFRSLCHQSDRLLRTMLEPGPSERESDFSDLEIKTERVLVDDLIANASKRKSQAAVPSTSSTAAVPVVVAAPVAEMTAPLPDHAMVRVHELIPDKTITTTTTSANETPAPKPSITLDGPILRATLKAKPLKPFEPREPPVAKVTRARAAKEKQSQDSHSKRSDDKEWSPSAKEGAAADKATRQAQNAQKIAVKAGKIWDCPVCEKKLNETERLRDHLKMHLSDEVSECFS